MMTMMTTRTLEHPDSDHNTRIQSVAVPEKNIGLEAEHTMLSSRHRNTPILTTNRMLVAA